MTGSDSDEGDGEFGPTAQSDALRRQQYLVGVGGAVVAGLAMTVSSYQHFPELPTLVPVLAGLLSAGLVYGIVTRSLFPTEEKLASE
ncbi:hypothetical protein BRC65_04235 [Halobacteriales archaeon QH_2_65_14]|jgi:hypothetical protein|nr:MAG: hypothetical protein BRC65_04235 [Halobacteriales archaeon QH_2_65_14]